MNIRFDGATVIVTGAARGFGREIVRRFAELGARVWGCDILADELEETRAVCGAGCEVRVVDVSDREAVGRFVAEAERRGAVDVLVNNAGGVLGQVGKPLEEVAAGEWQAIFDVNTTGVFYLAQAVAPGMKRAGRGRIVNISSGAGLGVSLTGVVRRGGAARAGGADPAATPRHPRRHRQRRPLSRLRPRRLDHRRGAAGERRPVEPRPPGGRRG